MPRNNDRSATFNPGQTRRPAPNFVGVSIYIFLFFFFFFVELWL